MLHFCLMASHWRLLRARGDGHHRALYGSIEHGRWEIAWLPGHCPLVAYVRERFWRLSPNNCFYQGDMR